MTRQRFRHALIVLTVVASAASTTAAAATTQVTAGPPSVTFPAPPTSADLKYTGASQPRDLSLPNSRVVLNPLDVLDSDTPVEQNNGADLPLSAGYFAADEAARLDDLVTIAERPQSTPSALKPEIAGFSDECRTDSSWTPSPNTTSNADKGVVTFSDTGSTVNTYGYISRTVSLDVDAYPILRISVGSAQQAWGLKVNDGTLGSDLVLQANTATPGVFDYDVKAATGWSGTKTFFIRIFSIGYQKTVSVDDVRMISRASSTPATTFNDEFTGLDPAWVVSAAGSASASGGSLHLQVPNTSGTAYGYVSRTMSVNVDRFPYLQISVSSAAQTWGLKVTDGATPDIEVQPGTSALGTFAYNLADITGWSGVKTVTIRIFASGYQKPITVDNLQLAASAAPKRAFRDEFGSTTLDPGWTLGGNTSATTANGVLTLDNTSTNAAGYGWVRRTVTLNVDTFPTLVISLPKVNDRWVLKANNNTGGADVYIQAATSARGRFSFDLVDKTGWHGTQKVTLILFAGGVSGPILVDYLYLRAAANAPWVHQASSSSTGWMPHQLPFDASYASGMSLTGRDVFHDVNSIGRSVTLTNPSASADIQLSGLYRGALTYDAATRVITVTNRAYRYAVALPAATTVRMSYYADKDAMLAGGPALASAGGSSGYWVATLVRPAAGPLNAGIGFALVGQPAGTAAGFALAAATSSAATNDPGTQAAYWTSFLASVPRPVNFDVQAVSAGTVTPQQVRRMYYRCWVFIRSQVLPAQTEIGGAHQQVATGKPALYLHGPAGAAASATWDSVMGMQYLAYTDPDYAWSALQGVAALVPASGLLPGEFLPSREMQTAWILYRVTGDQAKLSSVYAALRRDLIYKMDHPKYSGDTNPNHKAISFVSSAMIDAQYAIEIAQVLGRSSDVTDWTNRYNALDTNLHTWFWSSPTAVPVEKYDVVTGVRTVGRAMGTTTALHVPSITGSYQTGLINRFNEQYDPTKPFAGFGNGANDVRHPITSYTAYGLLEKGQTTRAQALENATIRDTVLADMISERYQWDASTPPHGEGQRPSLFGAAAFIDAVWMNNGYRMDDGTPAFVNLPGAQGGLTGLVFGARTLNVSIDSAAQQAVIGGTLVTPGCETVSVPMGATVALSAACSEGY